MEMALEQLLLAFAKGDPERGSGGSVEWSDIELAFEMAREALPGRYLEMVRELRAGDQEDAQESEPRIEITVRGGLIESITGIPPGTTVVVVDRDCDGETCIWHPDGAQEKLPTRATESL